MSRPRTRGELAAAIEQNLNLVTARLPAIPPDWVAAVGRDVASRVRDPDRSTTAFAAPGGSVTDVIVTIGRIHEALWSAIDGHSTEVTPLGEAVRGLTTALVDQTLARRTKADRETNDQFRLLAEEVKDFAIFLLDPDGYVRTWNSGAQRIKQYEAAEVIGKHYRMLYRPEDQADLRPERNLKRAIEAGRHEEEWWRRRKDGSLFWAEAVHTPIYTPNGQLIGVAKTVRDLTERKRYEDDLRRAKEAAEAANQAKNTFLANMSHEIRTPINAILGMVDFLREPAVEDEERTRHVEIIERNADVLIRLINDLLDLSKIEAGKVSLEFAELPLRNLLSALQGEFEPRARAKGLWFEVTIAENVPEYIVSDGVRLRQILGNVLGNAIKFTDAGEVRLEVRPLPKSAGVHVEFLIKDSGPGIPLEHQKRLFSPFSQADASVTRRFGGTGLGLALSRRLARELGGDLEIVACPEGEGCTFRLVVAPRAPGAGSSRPAPAAPRPAADLKGARLLVAEDSPDNQYFMRLLLERLGARADLVATGREAVGRALAERYDAVLMDIQMPELDGNSATRRLREAGFDRPIVALTAHALEEERRRALESGCDDYLTKPISRDRLVGCLGRLIGSSADGAEGAAAPTHET